MYNIQASGRFTGKWVQNKNGGLLVLFHFISLSFIFFGYIEILQINLAFFCCGF